MRAWHIGFGLCLAQLVMVNAAPLEASPEIRAALVLSGLGFMVLGVGLSEIASAIKAHRCQPATTTTNDDTEQRANLRGIGY